MILHIALFIIMTNSCYSIPEDIYSYRVSYRRVEEAVNFLIELYNHFKNGYRHSDHCVQEDLANSLFSLPSQCQKRRVSFTKKICFNRGKVCKYAVLYKIIEECVNA